jgi:3-deoxy-D-manno-octulosonic-acid transferase
MIWLYRLLYPLGFILLLPSYLLRMRRRGGYGHHFSHRFGLHSRFITWPENQKKVWLQAVSVGEVLAIAPILEALKKDKVSVYLTTTTSTGFKLAHEKYRSLTVGIGYFPIDFIVCSALAWRRINPDLAILTEGERWPEHMAQAKKRHVPVININARLSDKSFTRLRTIKRIAPAILNLLFSDLTWILPVSKRDLEHFRELGVETKRLRLTGNIKLDVVIVREGLEALQQLRCDVGLNTNFVLLGSSTWPGEELILIEALKATRLAGIACSLLIVPRHAERRDEIKKVLKQSTLSYHFRSEGLATAAVDVAVADTTGELRRLTQLADIAFVGKSLHPHTEGQTPVEAAALGIPIIVGPGMANFKAIVNELKAENGLVQIASAVELSHVIEDLLANQTKRLTLSQASQKWHSQNGGAVERTLEVIRSQLN